jgi:GntR family transcriptional regulator
LDLYDALRERMQSQHGPLGERLRLALGEVIDRGIVQPGESLPPEREMAERLAVSRSTLRQALKDLAQMGLVASRHGAGTMVLGRVPKSLSRLSGFTEDMQLRGLLPSSRVIERSIGTVDPESAFRTGLSLGTPVLILVRLRLAGGEPMSLERAMVPLDAVGEDYDGSGSLYDRMDARRARPRRIIQSLKAMEADADLAHQLAVRIGAAVLEITQLGYAEDGRVVEDGVSWYRGDRYKYVGEIRG